MILNHHLWPNDVNAIQHGWFDLKNSWHTSSLEGLLQGGILSLYPQMVFHRHSIPAPDSANQYTKAYKGGWNSSLTKSTRYHMTQNHKALGVYDKNLANERRRYICNVFSHWLRSCLYSATTLCDNKIFWNQYFQPCVCKGCHVRWWVKMWEGE